MSDLIKQFVIAAAPIAISFLALIISVVALWKTNLSKFRPVFAVGNLRFRIYPIRSGQGKWFIASVDLPISVANEGARPGRILDLRLAVTFPKLPIKDHYEYFRTVWEVDCIKFRQVDHKNRFEWIESAVTADWMPFIVLSKETITKHLVFESRWDKPVVQDEILFTVEILPDSTNKWVSIGEWKLSLSKVHWSELTENGTSIGTSIIDVVKSDKPYIYPEDLHKYTGTDEPIPTGGFRAGPSHLDYPDKKLHKYTSETGQK